MVNQYYGMVSVTVLVRSDTSAHLLGTRVRRAEDSLGLEHPVKDCESSAWTLEGHGR